MIGGVALAFASVFLHSYERAILFVIGGGMVVYGAILATAPSPR